MTCARIVPLMAAAALAAGCASSREAAPPDRALFRMEVSGVAPAVASTASAAVLATDEPSGPPVPAYTVALRIRRPDGTLLTAPRLTSYPSQRANIQMLEQVSYIRDFDVERAHDAWIADPVIGVLNNGCFVELAVHDAEGRPDEAALAYSVRLSGVRKPIGTRELGALAPDVRRPVTIQLPRVEAAEVAGARRVDLGAEIEIARLPDPSGAGELTVLGVVTRSMVPGPAEGARTGAARADDGDAAAGPDDGADAATKARRAALGSLVRAAAAGASSARLRVEAYRLPAGAADPGAHGAERLATLAVDSVLLAGATVSDRLEEAYLADWEIGARDGAAGTGAAAVTGSAAMACDPVIATHDSGLTLTVTGERELHVAWRTTPRIERYEIAPFAPERIGVASGPAPTAAERAFRLSIDAPVSVAAERTIPLVPGRSVHPVFRLPDGGTAALVVEYDVDYEPGR